MGACDNRTSGSIRDNDISSIEREDIPINVSEIEKIIKKSALSKEDKLSEVSFENRKIEMTIDVDKNNDFLKELPEGELEISNYSSVSDELLRYDGWDVLKVNYPNLGSVNMKESEKMSNEYGYYYFSYEEIDEKVRALMK